MKAYFKISTLAIILLLLSGLISASAQDQKQGLQWHSFEKAIQRSESTDKLIFVDVWAPWCGWCHKMKNDTYPQLSEVLNKNFVLTRLNYDNNQQTYHYKGQTSTPFEIAQNLKVEEVPAIIFLTTEGDYLGHLSGYRNAQSLAPILQYISSGTYKEQSFTQFQ